MIPATRISSGIKRTIEENMDLEGKTNHDLLLLLATCDGREYFLRQEIAGELTLRLEADARALWAVRVLDAWAEHHIRRAPSPVCQVDERWVIAVTAGETVAFYASTPDTARLAAAEAVYPELPVDVRAKLGERP